NPHANGEIDYRSPAARRIHSPASHGVRTLSRRPFMVPTHRFPTMLCFKMRQCSALYLDRFRRVHNAIAVSTPAPNRTKVDGSGTAAARDETATGEAACEGSKMKVPLAATVRLVR